jgi:hypothetical protein
MTVELDGPPVEPAQIRCAENRYWRIPLFRDSRVTRASIQSGLLLSKRHLGREPLFRVALVNESDPQSFSKRLAENFAMDAFPPLYER